VALSALPVVRAPAATYTTALGTRYQSDPLLGIVSPLNLLLSIVGSLLLYLLRARGDRRPHSSLSRPSSVLSQRPMTIPAPRLSRKPDDLLARNPDVSLFARVEGLIGEEDALLLIPALKRNPDERDRLRQIGDELDRIFERLLERSRRLAHAGCPPLEGEDSAGS